MLEKCSVLGKLFFIFRTTHDDHADLKTSPMDGFIYKQCFALPPHFPDLPSVSERCEQPHPFRKGTRKNVYAFSEWPNTFDGTRKSPLYHIIPSTASCMHVKLSCCLELVSLIQKSIKSTNHSWVSLEFSDALGNVKPSFRAASERFRERCKMTNSQNFFRVFRAFRVPSATANSGRGGVKKNSEKFSEKFFSILLSC